MLADLTSATPARRGLARSSLLAALVGDGRRLTPATLEVVPALISLIADPATPDRAALLSLITKLVTNDTC